MALKNDEKATFLSRFFKTGEGEYGYGDKFLGITVPVQRNIVKKHYKNLTLSDIETLLHNEYHEIRFSALVSLTYKMRHSNIDEQTSIVNLYLNNTDCVNNWDLVDGSASEILGKYLYDNSLDRTILYDLANSSDLWKQRIAIIATHYFILNGKFSDTINIAKLLMNNKHDLIHKAVGWMLREVGKKDYDVLYNFLLEHAKEMPRTMLRYSIEKFDPEVRNKFLKS